MDSTRKNGGLITTPVKKSENVNPNLVNSSPGIKSAKSQKSISKKQMFVSPAKKIKERRFVIAKRNSNKEKLCSKCKLNGVKKCLCMAYENLRASQEEFFKNRALDERGKESERDNEANEFRNCEFEDEERRGFESDFGEDKDLDDIKGLMGSSTVKRRRDKLMEEARRSIPEPGSGRVRHLVKAFERLLTIPPRRHSNDEDHSGEKELEANISANDVASADGDDVLIRGKKAMKWPLPGLQPNGSVSCDSMSSFCPSDLFLTSDNLGLDSRLASSWDSSHGSISTCSRISGAGRRSRRNSTESAATLGGSKWKKKQLRITNQKPFKLRTEQRGRLKEEELMKKIQKMVEEEERQRIPIAQGLPWTTDEPENLVKPPVKESTRPVDLKLHSDVRAVERAEFDHQVAEKLSFIEHYRMERERQQKMEEEEESRRLRKELVPRAQPMPYFDRPFIPRRSMKNPTIPKEPKFHIPQHKKIKCCVSWRDMSEYALNQQ